jgi:hypothetical protein
MDFVANLDPDRVESLIALQLPSMLNRRVAVLARVVEVPVITVKFVNGAQVNTLDDVIIQDRKQTEMTLIGVTGNDAVSAILNAHRTSSEVELTAEVVLRDDTYVLTHLSSKQIDSACQLVGATPLEVLKATETARRYESGLLPYIVDCIIAILGIKAVDSFPIMRKALMAVVLQAVSSGRVNGTPGRVSTLLFGPPGVGKGLINRAVQLLAAIFQPIGSNSVTPAGLAGWASRLSKNRTRIHPGVLVLASGGVAAMEDAQLVDSHSHRHTFGILAEMLSNGRLVRTTVGLIDLEVDTALQLDLNPKSTTRPAYQNKDVMLLEDIGLPVNLLSRIDIVFHFTRDVGRQMNTVLEMLSGIESVGPEANMADDGRVRELRVLVAHLRDNCPTIQLGGVMELITERMRDLFEQNKEKLHSLHLASDFVTRGGKSVL